MIAVEDEKTLITGHRGCGSNEATNDHDYCENTIESFTRAHKMGVDAIEFDVHLTKDHVPVIFHNFCIPCDGKNMFIHELSYEQFIRAGKEFVEKERPNLNVNDHRNVPGTLEDLFEHLDEDLVFNLELKYPSLEEMKELNIVDVIPRDTFVCHVMNVVLKYENRRVSFSSFDIDILISLVKYDASLPIFFLKDFVYTGSLNDFVPSFNREIKMCLLHGIKGVVFYSGTLNGDLAPLFSFIKSLDLHVMLYGEKLKDANFVREINDLGVVDGFIVDDISSARNCLRKTS